MPDDDIRSSLSSALSARFGELPKALSDLAIDEAAAALTIMAARGSVRAFCDRAVDPALIELLCAIALSSPTKSDLQQRDFIIIRDGDLRAEIDSLVSGQSWVAGAPGLLIVCGNNRRQRQVHEMRGRPFANDHLDAFFNAAVDGGIALGAFVAAADAVGLGCCPVSAVRNEATRISALLGLPDHVFPVAGLAYGWPHGDTVLSPRLPLSATVHIDRFSEDGIDETIKAYDKRRPYTTQRFEKEDGHDPHYGWSEDKARQYARSERTDFGAFVRARGFKLD